MGLTFAYCAKDRLRHDGIFAMPSFSIVAMFGLIVILPYWVYLLLVHPAWSWFFWVSPQKLPLLMIVPSLALLLGSLFAGWLLGQKFLAAKRDAIFQGTVLAGPLLIVSLITAFWRRVGYYGSYDAFHEGRALRIMDVKLGYVLLAGFVALVVAASVVGMELHRDARRARLM